MPRNYSPRVPFTCPHCGTTTQITVARSRKKFCNVTCFSASRRSAYPLCEACQARVPTPTHRFCSDACYRATKRAAAFDQISKRFWSRIAKGDGSDACWLWTGMTDASGYGKLWVIDRGILLAHRMSWEFHNGPIPDGLWVLHDCPTGDNPSCVRPEHLFLGTVADNNDDMIAKGRNSHGDRHVGAKVTAEQVLEIRARFVIGQSRSLDFAREYGVSRQNIQEIVMRRTWKAV